MHNQRDFFPESMNRYLEQHSPERDISRLKFVNLFVWAVDIGSVKRKRFAWCRISREERNCVAKDGDDIVDLAEGIADDLSAGRSVALGFECPLFVRYRRILCS